MAGAAVLRRAIVFSGFATGQIRFSEIDRIADTRMVKRTADAPIVELVCTAGGRLLAADENEETMWADLSAIRKVGLSLTTTLLFCPAKAFRWAVPERPLRGVLPTMPIGSYGADCFKSSSQTPTRPVPPKAVPRSRSVA